MAYPVRSACLAGVALVATTLSAGGVANAMPPWVVCEPTVTNAPLEPLPDGTFPSDPANAFDGARTRWTTTGLEINIQTNGGDKRPFFIRGMNYEPTQIGGSAAFTPFNDFFYTNTNKTWQPLWDRDIELMRAMGVNAVRNYGMWKWEPGFAEGNPPGNQIGPAQYWDKMNWSAAESAENDAQFCIKDSFTYKHPTHDDFLDRMWNGGKDPIYVWIGISVEEQMFDANVSAATFEDYRQFYLYTAKWLAKKYGNHPAVMGYVVGNEIANADRVRTSKFWNTINELHQVVKASAPGKLTMTVFHDTPDYYARITAGRFAGKTGPQVYEADAWGFNPYNNVGADGNALDRYAENVVKNCTQADGDRCVKPLIWGEWGVPANTRKSSTQKSKLYPVGWVAPNFVFMKNPPAARCLAADEQGPPPGSGGNAAAEYKAGETSAVLLPSRAGDYKLPKELGKFYKDSKRNVGDPLPAALQADYAKSFWKVTVEHKADNDAPANDWKFSSGGFAFEYRDEWWKVNEHPDFHGISGTPTNCPGGCGTTPCEPGPANPVFPGGWGDEQWFGVHGAEPNGRARTAPVIGSNGKLNGKPDTLNPRASVVALCEAYGGCAAATDED